MAKAPVDNYTRPEDKAKWSFGGSADEIKVGVEKAGEQAQGIDGVTDDGGRGNGGKPKADK